MIFSDMELTRGLYLEPFNPDNVEEHLLRMEMNRIYHEMINYSSGELKVAGIKAEVRGIPEREFYDFFLRKKIAQN